MKAIIKYIEHKPTEHTDHGEAWIARAWPSSSGRTLYFNNMALKRGSGVEGNHFDIVTGESYWVSGVKKRGSNCHWAGGGPIQIEHSLVEWYQELVQNKEYCDLVVIRDLPKPDISKFNTLENMKLRSERT
jgi:hypothetical protein